MIRSFLGSRWMLYGPALVLSLLIVAGGWFGFGEYKRRQREVSEATKPKALPDPIGRSYIGKIRAQKTVLIPAPVAGTLESIEVSDGDEVFEGQVLGRIQNSAIVVGHVLESLGAKLFNKRFCIRHAGLEAVCVHNSDCGMRALWIGLQHMLEKVLFDATLADLLQKESEMQGMLEARHGELILPAPMQSKLINV